MVDKQIIALVIALNAIACGVLYNRFNDHPLVQTFESKVIEAFHSVVPPKVPDRCGALKWDEFIIVSQRVVTPDGVIPAAGQHYCFARHTGTVPVVHASPVMYTQS